MLPLAFEPFTLSCGGILTILWIVFLAKAATSGQWLWFVSMLIFPCVAILYPLIGWESEANCASEREVRDLRQRVRELERE